MYLRKTTESAVPFMTRSRLNIPETELEITESAIAVTTVEGQHAILPTYVSYEITKEKPLLAGLPSSFDRDKKVETLILHCTDPVLNVNVDLYYTVFEDTDMITRSVHICNQDEKPIYLTKALSACLDMDDNDYEMLTLHGSWARERQMDRRAIGYGKTSVGSIKENLPIRSIRLWRG